MAVDRGLIAKEIIEQLGAVAAIVTALGSPPRIYLRPPETAVFPWVRIDFLPATWLAGTLGGGVKPNWIRQFTVQFTIFDLSTSILTVTAIQKLIADTMDKFPGLASITNCTIGQCIPGNEFTDYDVALRTAIAVLEYTMSFEDTA